MACGILSIIQRFDSSRPQCPNGISIYVSSTTGSSVASCCSGGFCLLDTISTENHAGDGSFSKVSWDEVNILTYDKRFNKLTLLSGSRGFFSPGPHTTRHAGQPDRVELPFFSARLGARSGYPCRWAGGTNNGGVHWGIPHLDSRLNIAIPSNIYS